MTEFKTVVGVFADHEEAEAAVKKLASEGIDIKYLSVVGKGYHTDEKIVGFYNAGDRIEFWVRKAALGRPLGLALWRAVYDDSRRRSCRRTVERLVAIAGSPQRRAPAAISEVLRPRAARNSSVATSSAR